MPPALALPLPMRTDPLETLLLPVITWMAPLLHEPLVLIDTTTLPHSETPAPLCVDRDPPVKTLPTRRAFDHGNVTACTELVHSTHDLHSLSSQRAAHHAGTSTVALDEADAAS